MNLDRLGELAPAHVTAHNANAAADLAYGVAYKAYLDAHPKEFAAATATEALEEKRQAWVAARTKMHQADYELRLRRRELLEFMEEPLGATICALLAAWGVATAPVDPAQCVEARPSAHPITQGCPGEES